MAVQINRMGVIDPRVRAHLGNPELKVMRG
jgi:hypothetical protein